jgi:hypothetical protein
MEVSIDLHALVALLLGKHPRYPLDRRLGGPQSRSGRCGGEKISPLRGIEPRPSSLKSIVIPTAVTILLPYMVHHLRCKTKWTFSSNMALPPSNKRRCHCCFLTAARRWCESRHSRHARKNTLPHSSIVICSLSQDSWAQTLGANCIALQDTYSPTRLYCIWRWYTCVQRVSLSIDV